MKNTFPGHYRPNEDDLNRLWENCLFVLDANVLLHLYRYTPKTREGLQNILAQISNRLWIPHQAAFEYQSNRLKVIIKQVEAYEEISDFFNKTYSQIENKLNSYRRHPFIDATGLLKDFKRTFEKITSNLKSSEEQHPDLLIHDTLRDEITELLNGKIGEPYPEDKLQEIYKDGDLRFGNEKPPGYKDCDNKVAPEKFGDLVLWYQIIDKAKKENQSIILVTDDTKEDWWWKFKGRTIGPRPELAEEMLKKAEVSFYMYRSDQFMENARKHLKRQVEQNAIDEIRAIRKHEEIKNRLEQVQQELSYAISKQMQIEEEKRILERHISEARQEIVSDSSQLNEIEKNMAEISHLSVSKENIPIEKVRKRDAYLNSLLEKQKYLEKTLHQKESYERNLMEMEHKAKYLESMKKEIGTKRAELETYLAEVVTDLKMPNK